MRDDKSKRDRIDPGLTSNGARLAFVGVLIDIGQDLVKGQNDLVGISLD
jgi:hypothetical protein